MPSPNIRMTDWMAVASGGEQEQLARMAGTSRPYLYKLAAGGRVASAEKAADIEAAAEKLRALNQTLPRLLRTDLCPACAGCPFALQCLQGRID